MTGPDVTVDITMLVYAFRYALGRRTAAVADVAATLIHHRERLPEWERRQIAEDIGLAVRAGHAGAPCDVDEWRRVARELMAVQAP